MQIINTFILKFSLNLFEFYSDNSRLYGEVTFEFRQVSVIDTLPEVAYLSVILKVSSLPPSLIIKTFIFILLRIHIFNE